MTAPHDDDRPTSARIDEHRTRTNTRAHVSNANIDEAIAMSQATSPTSRTTQQAASTHPIAATPNTTTTRP